MGEEIKLGRLLTKTLVLLAFINFILVPLVGTEVGKISWYNLVVPGRLRFPYGEDPALSYNLSLFNLEANIRSHVVANRPINTEEYRIFVLGDSSIWGTLLRPKDTLVGQLNQLNLTTTDGKEVTAYNLGYPTMSLTKDLLFLEKALDYQPDIVIWMVTLESFPNNKQLTSPIVSHNKMDLNSLITEYDLELDPNHQAFQQDSYWDQTLIGQRRNLADIFRLQLYGVMWGITNIDQYYPADYEPAKRNFEEDATFYDWGKGEMKREDLAYHLLQSGHDLVGDIPMILVNEPVLVSDGLNSDLRYNYYYPVWAYDQYRNTMAEFSEALDWHYLDLWDLIPEMEFTNTAIHLTPLGTETLAKVLSETIIEISTDTTPRK